MSGNRAASILARLKNIAKANGLIYNELLVRYGIERMLKRIERSPFASKCILKGGTLFTLWSDGFTYRPTMDADLEFRGDGSPDNIRRMFLGIARMDDEGEDGVRVDPESIAVMPIREDDQYGGVRVTMCAYIGRVRIPLQFDVGIGDAITPVPRKENFPVLLDGSVPRLRIYPRETVIAEKFETIVRRGIGNSRMKDYYDLWILSADKKVDVPIARLAVTRTFARRKAMLPVSVPEGLSDEFGNDKAKIAQWQAFLRKNRLSSDGLQLIDIIRILRRFLMPLIER